MELDGREQAQAMINQLAARTFVLGTIRHFFARAMMRADQARTQPMPVPSTPRVALPEPEEAARALRHAVIGFYAEHRDRSMAPSLVKALHVIEERVCYATLLLACELVKRDESRADPQVRQALVNAELALLIAPGAERAKENRHARSPL